MPRIYPPKDGGDVHSRYAKRLIQQHSISPKEVHLLVTPPSFTLADSRFLVMFLEINENDIALAFYAKASFFSIDFMGQI